MSNGFNSLVDALEGRYDFQSARTMTRDALKGAGLKEEPKYSDADLQKFVDALASTGTSLDSVWSKLGVSPSGAPAPAPAATPAAKPEAKKDDKPAAKPEAKKDDKPEAKKDDKPAAKPEAKKDDKPTAKKDDKKAPAKKG